VWHRRLIGYSLAGACGNAALWTGRERIAVDEGMARGSALDFAQPDKIAALEVAIAMLKLPQRRIWCSGMEDVAHCFCVSTNDYNF